MERRIAFTGTSWANSPCFSDLFRNSNKKKVYHNYSWHRAHLEEALRGKLDGSEFSGFL